MDYKDLLKRAEEKISKELTTEGRFKISEAKVLVQGNNTIVTNFSEISSGLGRDSRHLLKFLSKQLAAPGSLDGNRVSFLGKFTKDKIDNKIKLYAKNYVFCSVCGKPDTKLIEEEGILKMKCEACGSKRFVKRI
ncbi:MAG: translation initiation factor IF-2 subunit beta [Candidatus Aenigmarchaeota archaeon]|nr:translation initiation factor IF-2 subunit beta [Candidatus Aenigmarchaeota archaeon]